MAESNYREEALLIGHWWADRITHPPIEDEDVLWDRAIDRAMIGKLEVDDVLHDNIKEAIAQYVTNRLNRDEQDHIILSVEYGPCHNLGIALRAVNVPGKNFPRNTYSSIGSGRVWAGGEYIMGCGN